MLLFESDRREACAGAEAARAEAAQLRAKCVSHIHPSLPARDLGDPGKGPFVRRVNRTAIGSLAGQVDLFGDWDSAETDAEIAADFGPVE